METITSKYMFKQDERTDLASQTTEVALDDKVIVWIGTQLKGMLRDELLKLLHENVHSFAEESSKMEGVNKQVIEHQLAINLKHNLVRSKKCWTTLKRNNNGIQSAATFRLKQ